MEAGSVSLVSVVIPCRNAATDLRGQLSALARQGYQEPWEVIVSDNGSTDATAEVALSFRDVLPIRVVNSRDRPGHAHARNAGADAAAGDKILFLDADDEAAPGYIRAMTNALESSDAAAARLDWDKLNPPWVRNSRLPGQQQELLDVLGFLPFGLSCGLGVRRTAYEAVNGFHDVPYAEDVDFCWRLQLAGKTLQFVPDAVLHQRFRGTLRGLFDQSRRYGTGQVVLYQKFAPAGMPRRSMQATAVDYARTLWWLRKVRDKADWGRWVHRFGYRVGRVEGSVRRRTLYL